MQRRSGGRALRAVLFTDIVGSTSVAAELGDARWAELVASHHRFLRREIARFHGSEIDTAGDGFFATFQRPADAIRCAAAAMEAVHALGIEIRAAVNFGELEATGHKPGGLVVNTAARIVALAGPAEILVSAAVRDILSGSDIVFEARGARRLKGIEGRARLFEVVHVDGMPLPPPLDADEAQSRRREVVPTTHPRRTGLFVGIGAGLVVVLVSGVMLLDADDLLERPPTALQEHVVVGIDPSSGESEATLALRRVEGAPSSPRHVVAAGEGGVWVLRPPMLTHLDPNRPAGPGGEIDVGRSAFDLQTGHGAVWVSSARTALMKVSPVSEEARPFLREDAAPTGLAITDSVWVSLNDGTLIRQNPFSGARVQGNPGTPIYWLAATTEAVWIADVLAGELIEVDPASLNPVNEPIEIGGTIDRIVADNDFVWVLDRSLGTVLRVDPEGGGEGEARVGEEATDMALGLGYVWISDREGSVYRIDSTTMGVESFRFEAEVLGVAVDGEAGLVWAYLGESLSS